LVMDQATVTTSRVRKRKADNQDNERLSKRLSLLNLERNGQKLYVPVEQPTVTTTTPKKTKPRTKPQDDDMMQVDDTKHKVYIYDLDAELSDSESSDDGKLVFLPDIEKHLRESRIPPSILANSEGELAGNNQLILYNVPSSLTVPEEQDSVRKAIIETRARARAKQERKRRDNRTDETENSQGVDARDWYNAILNGTPPTSIPVTQEAMGFMNGGSKGTEAQQMDDYDPDAMDLG